MRQEAAYCCICGAAATETVFVPSVGGICEPCLLQGRFLTGEQQPGRWRLAENAGELCPALRPQLEQLNAAGEERLGRKDYQGAREAFLESARDCRRAGKPLLAYVILKKALRLPGLSAEIYEELAGSVLDMQCSREAVRYLKLSSWLALKAEQDEVFERSLELLLRLCPQDDWIARARGRRRARGSEPGRRCRLCGRDEGQDGQLIQEERSAICGECAERLRQFSE